MGLFQIIKQRWMSRNTLPQIADEIADRCVDAVWQRVEFQVGTLAPAEARGYIRARGVAIVHPQIVSASAQHDVREHLRPQLHALTLEALTQRVQSRISTSVLHRQVRHAA